MENILEFIAEKTHGKIYRTAKIELEKENSSAQIEYDTAEEFVLKHSGENNPPKKYLSLKESADKISSSNLQILNYFLDGSRRVYKIDDIAYMQGTRKMIYPIIAGQVVVGNCRRAVELPPAYACA